MKTLLALLLLTGCAYAQGHTRQIRRDSLPKFFPPDVNSPERMPNARPDNSFYRYHMDSRNVVRATTDNMPVKVPDSSTHYTMLRSYQKYRKQEEPPVQFLKPMPLIVPKRFR